MWLSLSSSSQGPAEGFANFHRLLCAAIGFAALATPWLPKRSTLFTRKLTIRPMRKNAAY